MSCEENKSLIRRLFDEVYNAGNYGLLDQLIGASYVEHNPVANQAGGAAGVRTRIVDMRKAFPDLRFVLEELVAEDALVAARYRWQGTHRGIFLGIAPTGRRLSVRGMDFFRLEDGRLIEHWDLLDEFGMLSQLGDLG